MMDYLLLTAHFEYERESFSLVCSFDISWVFFFKVKVVECWGKGSFSLLRHIVTAPKVDLATRCRFMGQLLMLRYLPERNVLLWHTFL